MITKQSVVYSNLGLNSVTALTATLGLVSNLTN